MLSIIVPIGNIQGDIKKLSQWMHEIDTNLVEVILVHDQQDSRTGPALAMLIDELPNLTLHLINGVWNSPGAARNEGLLKATQEWIAFWDADDLPESKNVLDVISKIDLQTNVVVGQYIVMSAHSNTQTSKISRTSCVDDLISNPGLWRMVFRRQIFANYRFPNISMAEDQVYLVNSSLASRTIHFSPALFYKYFQGQPNQLTANPIKISDLNTSLRILSETFEKLSGADLRFSRLLYLRQFNTLLKNTRVSKWPAMGTKFREEYFGQRQSKSLEKLSQILSFYRILVLAKYRAR